jgi:hypothetical protein
MADVSQPSLEEWIIEESNWGSQLALHVTFFISKSLQDIFPSIFLFFFLIF